MSDWKLTGQHDPRDDAGETLRACPTCGTEFWYKGNKVYCTAECRRSAYGVELQHCQCAACRAAFTAEVTPEAKRHKLTAYYCVACRPRAYQKIAEAAVAAKNSAISRHLRKMSRRERDKPKPTWGSDALPPRHRRLHGKRTSVSKVSMPPREVKPAESETLEWHIRLKIAAEYGYGSWEEYDAVRLGGQHVHKH